MLRLITKDIIASSQRKRRCDTNYYIYALKTDGEKKKEKKPPHTSADFIRITHSRCGMESEVGSGAFSRFAIGYVGSTYVASSVTTCDGYVQGV